MLRLSKLALLVFLLTAVLTGIAAAEGPDYSIAYTVTVADDGSSLWHVEYRTILLTDTDEAEFEAYAANLSEVYLPEFRELMEQSAAQAAAATGRHMEIEDVSGDAVIQESPTGRYGVVVYTALWDGFARPDTTITIGDAFTGGMYLGKDNMLTIRIPDGYTVAQSEPEPDDTRDGLVWYGPRSFGAGEPRVVLEQQAFPLTVAAAGLGLALLILIGGYVFFHRRRNHPISSTGSSPDASSELPSLDERILQLLKSRGGELFQSEIVRITGLPRSTVSTALNDLHSRGMIVKVKKGRENLIRLPDNAPPDAEY